MASQVQNLNKWFIFFSENQGLLRNTIVDTSCIQIKPGERKGDLEENYVTLHHTIVNNKRITYITLHYITWEFFNVA